MISIRPNELIEVFERDDPDEFESRFHVSTFISSNQVLQGILGQEFDIFNSEPTIMQAALFYKANKIFEFIKSIDLNLIKKVDAKKRTINHYAAAGGNLEHFQKYEKVFDFMEHDDRSWTLFHYAANYNQPQIIKWGIKCQLPCDMKSNDGTPLRISCQNSYLRCVEVLCSSPIVQSNLKKPASSSTILLACLNNRFYEAIPFLIEAGMNPEKQLFDGWPLLFFGATSNSESIPRELIRRGVNVDLEDNLHWTALFAAVSRRRYGNVKFLLKHNANPLHVTGVNFTVFSMANSFHPDDPTRRCALKVRKYVIKRIIRNFVNHFINEFFEE